MHNFLKLVCFYKNLSKKFPFFLTYLKLIITIKNHNIWLKDIIQVLQYKNILRTATQPARRLRFIQKLRDAKGGGYLV